MLYKYLYNQQASGLFDVEKFASNMGLDLDKPFSQSFMKDSKPVFASVKADKEIRLSSSCVMVILFLFSSHLNISLHYIAGKVQISESFSLLVAQILWR
jgi:hypothetical protein